MTGKVEIPWQPLLSRRTFLGAVVAAPVLRAAGGYPQAVISEGDLRVTIYLPDRDMGYYRSTRFDWSGVIQSLEYRGHNFYGPWFDERDASVRDFVHRDGKIVAGPASGITGPVNEFQRPLGFDAAKPGEVFVKVGVAALRKPDEMAYNAYRAYEIVSWGEWTVKPSRNAISFVHRLSGGGFGYEYQKTLRLIPGKTQMAMEHRLKNTGAQPIATNVYNHNFLVLDRSAPGPDFEITTPFAIASDRPPDAAAAAIRGNKAIYVKRIEAQERVSFPMQGFGSNPSDHDFRIENKTLGVGMRIQGDRPLSRVQLWSIRSVLSVEPFIDISVEPGKSFDWTTVYSYYTLG